MGPYHRPLTNTVTTERQPCRETKPHLLDLCVEDRLSNNLRETVCLVIHTDEVATVAFLKVYSPAVIERRLAVLLYREDSHMINIKLITQTKS